MPLLLALVACFGDDDRQPADATDPLAHDADSPPPPAVTSLSDLHPLVASVGRSDAAPRAISIDFLHPVVRSSAVGKKADGVGFSVEPAVPGKLVWESTKRLVFTPRDGLAPETTYTASLTSLKSVYGELSGTSNLQLTTPALELLEVVPVRHEKQSLTVDLVYSGPVADGTPKFGFDGAAVRVESVHRRGHVLRVLLDHRPLAKRAGRMQVDIDGVTSAMGRATAPSGSRSWRHDPKRKPLIIKNARISEGSSSFAIEVVCTDKAVKGHDRWFWDDDLDQSYYLSQRCVLDKDALAEAVHLEPAVPFEISQSRSGFRIVSDQLTRGNVHLRIDAGAVSVDGGVTVAGFSKDLFVPALKAQVQLPAKGRYLARDSWTQLPVRYRNIDQLRLQVRHIPRDNLVFWMTGGDERATERTSDLLVDTNLPVSGAVDDLATTWIDVKTLVPDAGPGVYELTVSGGRDRHGGWASADAARLLRTDLQIVAKTAETPPKHPYGPSIAAWALDAATGKPQKGVTIEAVRASGKVVGTCKTDGDGACSLDLERGVDKAAPVALIASKGTDFTYLAFDDLKTDIAEYRVQGESYLSDRPWRASLYADRGVYRPGDTVHVAGILRDAGHVAPQAGLPVTLHVTDSRGKLVKQPTLATNAAGMVDFDLKLHDYAPTGTWRVQLRVADEAVETLSVSVEEFVPERMKVTASVDDSEGFLASQAVPVDIDARYLFGGSAAGSRVEVDCRMVTSAFRPSDNANLSYGVQALAGETVTRSIHLGLADGKLDADGHTQLSCPVPLRTGAMAGPAKVIAEVAVYEAGSGRTTHATATTAVHPEQHYIGLSSGTKTARAGQPVTVQGAVVDWGGAKLDSVGSVDVEIFRLESEWGWTWDSERETERYMRYQRPVKVHTETVAVSGGGFSLTWEPAEDAERFVVRARAGKARTDLAIDGAGRRSWWDPSRSDVDATPRPLAPRSLAVSAPKEIKVGEAASVSVAAPYAGRMLMTVETSGVVTSEWIDVQPGPVHWSFTLGEFAPNVYVSALLVKDRAGDGVPDRAFGVQSVTVEPTAYSMDVAIEAPDKVRSNSPLEVVVKVADPDAAFVTVAAVDEGILQLTGFDTPDPNDSLFPSRGLGVQTYETIGWAVHLPGGPTSSHGGGGDYGMGRVQMVKPTALWSGVVPVENGEARVTLDVPSYRGALRVMAIAAGSKKTGSAETVVTVADPLVLQTTLPRFLVEGDEFELPVFVTNLSGRKRDVDVALEVGDGMIEFLGDRKGMLTIEDGGSAVAVFQARATGRSGHATFAVKASAGNLVSTETLDVPFGVDGPRVRSITRTALQPGKTDLLASMADYVPTTEQTTWWVTPNPYVQALGHLEYVVKYPYGCIEQTTSATRPLLYVGDLLPALTPDVELDDKVSAGIDRVLSMQTPSGGFSYWPGGHGATAWGTAYATHMLIDAKAKGHPVPQQAIDDALDFLEDDVDRHGYAEAYEHYVLAVAGRGRKARARALLSELGRNPKKARAEDAYLLKAALYQAGDRRYDNDLRNPDFDALVGRTNDWRFYSGKRARAMALSIWQDLFGADGGGEHLANAVARGLENNNSRFYSTQEIAWAVTALGKRVKSSGASSFSVPKLSIDGKAVDGEALSTVGSVADRTWTVRRASERKGVSLQVDSIEGGALYLMTSTIGVPEDAAWEYGNKGLAVTREYLHPQTGQALSTLGLGDLVTVKVTLSNPGVDAVQNIALVDRLPAGFELESLDVADAGDWTEWSRDHINLRDDRIEVFGTAPRGTVELRYTVRAVTAGDFAAPPIEAEAMYDPSVWTRAPGQRVTIEADWKGGLL